MKTIPAVLLLSLVSCCAFGQDKAAVSAAQAACGPRDNRFKVTADKSQHPAPSPQNGKALIYVVQKDDATTRVGADGKWIGAARRRMYFFTSVDPGEHHLSAIGRIGAWSHVSLLELNAKIERPHAAQRSESRGARFSVCQS